MTFIRSKEIPPHSGNWYDYEVKTVHVGPKVMQKVVRYIGRSGKSGPSVGIGSESGIPATILKTPATHAVSDARIPKMKTPAKRRQAVRDGIMEAMIISNQTTLATLKQAVKEGVKEAISEVNKSKGVQDDQPRTADPSN